MKLWTRSMARLRFYKKSWTVLVAILFLIICHNLLTTPFVDRDTRSKRPIKDLFTLGRGDIQPPDVDAPETFNSDPGDDFGNPLDPNWKMEKKDWNDYKLMARDKKRYGPGEKGKAVTLRMSALALNRSNELFERHKHNVSVSNAISLERSIGDQRDAKCRERLYLKHLPRKSVTVIIPFHNEHDSTILRTVHSVVNRSPPSLLREIVLVDDASTLESLKRPLDDYVARHFTNVKVIHSSERLGLTKSRILGADNSTGEFLVVIDAHIEVNYNFLPPLIEPMFLDYRTIACPVVDIIDRINYKITAIPAERNAFSWSMRNEHLPILPKDKDNLPEPYNVPVMLGCAFAITRRWWEEIGKFDPGFKVWGEEQYELSFKTWMCGGRMVDVHCSRMAHLFRNALPYSIDKGVLGGNIVRLALVWMDEYKEYVFQRFPKLREMDPGDISEQLDLRRRLQCKSFHWYMTNIAPDILWNWPAVEPPLAAWGFLKSNVEQNLCVAFHSISDPGSELELQNCSNFKLHADKMVFDMNWRKNVKSRYSRLCLEARNNDRLRASPFRLNATGQQFAWDRHRGWLVSSASGHCLHANLATMKVDMKQCQEDASFGWTFQGFNETTVDSSWRNVENSLKERNLGVFGKDDNIT